MIRNQHHFLTPFDAACIEAIPTVQDRIRAYSTCPRAKRNGEEAVSRTRPRTRHGEFLRVSCHAKLPKPRRCPNAISFPQLGWCTMCQTRLQGEKGRSRVWINVEADEGSASTFLGLCQHSRPTSASTRSTRPFCTLLGNSLPRCAYRWCRRITRSVQSIVILRLNTRSGALQKGA
jgi:hypothetical protein